MSDKKIKAKKISRAEGLEQSRENEELKLKVAENLLGWQKALADYQNLERPIRTNLVCGFVFDTLTNINKIARISNQEVFKNFCLPYIEKAMLVNQWLDSSKLNSKKGSKHPTALGHRLWADHIINSINSNESTTKSTS